MPDYFLIGPAGFFFLFIHANTENGFRHLAVMFFNGSNMRGSRKYFQRGSDFDIFMREGIQIPLKAGYHWPASETPFNGVSLAGR